MTPSTLTHDELHELLALYAVGSVTAAERTLVETHLDGCAECRAELAGQLEALAALTPEELLPPAQASWEEVRARLSPGADEPRSSARVVSLPRRVLPRIAAAAAVAACSVFVTLALTRDDPGSPQVTAPIVSKESTQLAGSVELFNPDSAGGHVILDLRNVPDAPPGHHYEVWVLRPGDGAEMEAIGAFTPESGRASLSLPLPSPGEYVALDISIQEDAGPPQHSGSSLGGATLTS